MSFEYIDFNMNSIFLLLLHVFIDIINSYRISLQSFYIISHSLFFYVVSWDIEKTIRQKEKNSHRNKRWKKKRKRSRLFINIIISFLQYRTYSLSLSLAYYWFTIFFSRFSLSLSDAFCIQTYTILLLCCYYYYYYYFSCTLSWLSVAYWNINSSFFSFLACIICWFFGCYK